MKKRIICLSLVMCMILGIFSGCKSKKETEDNDSDYEIEYVDEYVTEDGTTVDGDSADGTTSADKETSSKNKTNKNKTSSASGTKADTAPRDLKGRTVTFMTIWAEPEKGTSAFWNKYWKVKTNVEKDYNCKFKHVYGTGNWYDTWVASVMAGNPTADVICCKEDPYSGIKSDLFYDVSKLKEFNFSEEKWQRAALEMGKVNNKQYVFCAAKYQPLSILLYNKDLLKKYGIEDLYTLQKKGQLNLEKFSSFATQISAKTGKPSVLPGINVFNVHKWFAWACGGKFMDRTANTMSLKSTIDTPEVKKGFEMAQDLVNKKVIETSGETGGNWLWSRELFAKGGYPFLIAGDLESALKDCNFEVGACVMPALNGGKMNVTDTIQWCAMPKNVKNPQDVAAVFNKMAEVIFIVDYKSRYQDIASDDIMEMINTEAKQQAKGAVKLDYSCIFLNDIWNNGVGSAMRQMTTNEKTTAQTILTVKNVFATAISNKYGK